MKMANAVNTALNKQHNT